MLRPKVVTGRLLLEPMPVELSCDPGCPLNTTTLTGQGGGRCWVTSLSGPLARAKRDLMMLGAFLLLTVLTSILPVAQILNECQLREEHLRLRTSAGVSPRVRTDRNDACSASSCSHLAFHDGDRLLAELAIDAGTASKLRPHVRGLNRLDGCLRRLDELRRTA